MLPLRSFSSKISKYETDELDYVVSSISRFDLDLYIFFLYIVILFSERWRENHQVQKGPETTCKRLCTNKPYLKDQLPTLWKTMQDEDPLFLIAKNQILKG